MSPDETRLFSLIDERAAQYGYGVSKLQSGGDDSVYTVELTSPANGKRAKRIVIFRDAVQQTVRENRLAPAIAQNIDNELDDGDSGAIRQT